MAGSSALVAQASMCRHKMKRGFRKRASFCCILSLVESLNGLIVRNNQNSPKLGKQRFDHGTNEVSVVEPRERSDAQAVLGGVPTCAEASVGRQKK